MGIEQKKVTKREFLRSGVCGVCGIALGMSTLEAIGRGIRFLGPELDLPLPEETLWKWSKEAAHYIQTPKGIKCLTCPNECEINDEKKAECKNHIVVNNKLYTIAYGNPCAVHVDPVEKKPLNHYHPGSRAYSIATAGCNLKCLNCQNWSISQVGPKETQNYDLMPPKVVEECLANGCTSIAYTYSEPITFYEYMYDTALLARAKGIGNIMVTAGYINEKPLRKLCGVIDAANVDLKSFSEELYMMLNSGKLQPVLNTLKIMKELGVWLEITNLVVPTWTDDMDMIKEMCGWLASNGFEGTPLHFSRFYPQYQLQNLPPTPQSTLTQAREIAIKEGIKYVYIGNIPGDPSSNTYCPGCKKLLVERKGYTISQNHIIGSRCRYCSAVIPGVWG
jgi:pyruvate formate lyase activating enzyme